MLSILVIFLFVVALVLFGVMPTMSYFLLKRRWDSMPVVAATISEARLDHRNETGRTVYEAIIKFQYNFRGRQYESKSPALRGIQVFPLYAYEANLLEKYKEGEIYNARVFPNMPELAYLEIAPLSKLSILMFPLILGGLFAYFIGVGAFFYYLA